jgi:DNA-binding NtrC family response regulator
VIREMTRAGRPQPAYATMGVGGSLRTPMSAPPQAVVDEIDDVGEIEDEEAVDEIETAPAVGSRLADVAKAAALKAERAIIEDTLNSVHWNRRRAAEQLGVSYKTLLNKIKECGISRK